MSERYSESQRALQDRFDTRRLADRLATATTDIIGEHHRAFIERRDMFFLATADEAGWPQVSYKGGEPGFVRVLDDHSLTFPVYEGNGMYLSAGNLAAQPRIGLLFIDWSDGTRLRVSGDATIEPDPAPSEVHPGAQLVVRVRAREVFANCRRYVHRMQLVERSRFVPSATAEVPVPDWKRDPWFEGTLPAGDPALDPSRPSADSIPRF